MTSVETQPVSDSRPDARLILLLCLCGVICAFSATSASQFVLLGLSAMIFGRAFRLAPARLLAPVWRFRYLLIATFGAHLLLSSGHTLGGTSWLFRDGLETGVLMTGRLSLALLFASALCLLCSPQELAAVVTLLLRPLSSLGVPLERCSAFVALVFSFLPLVASMKPAGRVNTATPIGLDRAFGQRLQALMVAMEILLERLLKEAQHKAHCTRGGRDLLRSGWRRFALADFVSLTVALVLLVFFWRLG